MEIFFNKPDFNRPNNKITRNKHNIYLIPFITIYNYFFWNYENLYFLLLAFFQILTMNSISLLPKEWSPTGPFSTAIPLVLCIMLDIINDLYSWIKCWLYDLKENNKIISCYQYKKKCADLLPGDIITLKKGDICPVDGLLIDLSQNDRYSKISMSLLTGESDIHYIEKVIRKRSLKDYLHNTKLVIDKYYPNDFKNISGKLFENNKLIAKVNGTNLIVSGSVILSDEIKLLTIACGKERKGNIKQNKKSKSKYSNLDLHVANYMIKISAILLTILITFVSLFKLYTLKEIINGNYIYNFIFFSVQNWIIFNGIIPFSLKIMLILGRNLESSLVTSYKKVRVNNSSLIDNICTIKSIVSDKTGTLTKNELDFTIAVDRYSKKIIDIKNYKTEKINLEFFKCLGICVHVQNGIFSTTEDKVIRTRYPYLNGHVLQKGNKIKIYTNNNNEYHYDYVEVAGLDFTYERKMSSKIVQDKNGKLYIYTKGSLSKFEKLITKDCKKDFDLINEIISQKYPSLRVLACGFKEIQSNELTDLLNDSINNSIHVKNLEQDLVFLGIIGIKDNLQEDVDITVKKLKDYGINISMCTGDRKITALAIAEESNIISKNVIDFDLPYQDDCKGKSIIFSGDTLDQKIKQKNKRFIKALQRCKNFVAYNLIPEHKSRLIQIMKKSNSKTKILAIGDGFNDIGMFSESDISVAIKGNENVEEQSDFVVNNFSNLQDLITIGINYYKKNSLLTNFIFYRCTTVITCLIINCLINWDKITESVFNGFVLQGFNFAWTLYHILSHLLITNYFKKNYEKEDFKLAYKEEHSSYFHTSIWNLNGMLTGILVSYYTYKYFWGSEIYSDILGFIIILLLNLKLYFHKCYSLREIFFSFVGIGLFLLYTIFMGTFGKLVIILFSQSSMIFWKNILTYFVILNLTLKV